MNTSARFNSTSRARLRALPAHVHPGTHPLGVSPGAAVRLVKAFMANGGSKHGVRGGLIWVVLEHCAAAGLKCTVHEYDGLGYWVELLKEAQA
jgi:hypothetical protein